MYRYGELTFSYSFFPVWTHKLRFLAKLLHIPKRAKNSIFYRKFRVFPVFFVFSFFSVFFGLFRNSLFWLFRFYTETESFDVSIELKQTGDPPKQFKREYIGVFFWTFRVVAVCFGLLRNSSVYFGCFDIHSKHRNKPKIFCFLFHETNRNKRETDLVSICFGSNRNKFLFVSRTPYYESNRYDFPYNRRWFLDTREGLISRWKSAKTGFSV
jgi:hypothetical protein